MEALLLDAERALVATALAADQANSNHNPNKPLAHTHNSVSTTTDAMSKPPTRGHRSQSQVWKFLTREENPHRATRSACMHCLQDVPHHRKSEKARAHLLRCEAFRAHMADTSLRPEWFDHEPPRRQKKKSNKTTASGGGNEEAGVTVVPAAQPPLKAVDRMPTTSAAAAAAVAMAGRAPPSVMMVAAPVAASLMIQQPHQVPVPVLAAKRRVDQDVTADPLGNSNKRQATGHNTSSPSTSVCTNGTTVSTHSNSTFTTGTSAQKPNVTTKKHTKPMPVPSFASSHASIVLPASAQHAPEVSKLHATLAMFFYSTATPFARVENAHLHRAFKLSNPSVTLPTASQLTGPLLDQAFATTQTHVNAALSAFEFNSIVVNGWSSSSSSPGNGANASSQRRVDYVVVNEQHAFLLESSVLGVEQRQDADLLAHKMIGIMNRCDHPISGTVLGSLLLQIGV